MCQIEKIKPERYDGVEFASECPFNNKDLNVDWWSSGQWINNKNTLIISDEKSIDKIEQGEIIRVDLNQTALNISSVMDIGKEQVTIINLPHPTRPTSDNSRLASMIE